MSILCHRRKTISGATRAIFIIDDFEFEEKRREEKRREEKRREEKRREEKRREESIKQ